MIEGSTGTLHRRENSFNKVELREVWGLEPCAIES